MKPAEFLSSLGVSLFSTMILKLAFGFSWNSAIGIYLGILTLLGVIRIVWPVGFHWVLEIHHRMIQFLQRSIEAFILIFFWALVFFPLFLFGKYRPRRFWATQVWRTRDEIHFWENQF